MPKFVYRNIGGAIKAVQVSDRPPMRGTPVEATQDFHQTVLNAYRQVEADGKWRGPYPKGFVKRVHETALERDRNKRAS